MEGIDVFGFEVTDEVRARQRVEALAEQLRESEERLRRVVEASGAGLWEMDVTTGHITTEGHVLSLMGLPPSTPFSYEVALASIHAEDRGLVAGTVSAAIAGEQEGRYFMVFRTIGRGDAPEQWVESRGNRRLGAHGKAVSLAGVMVDITARKEAEAILAQQSRNNALVAQTGLALSLGITARGMLQGCVEALVDHLGAAFAGVWLLPPQQNRLELHASTGLYTHLDGSHGRVPVGRGRIGRIAETQQPHLTNGVLDEPRGEDLEWARREGMVAFAGYPLIGGRQAGGRGGALRPAAARPGHARHPRAGGPQHRAGRRAAAGRERAEDARGIRAAAHRHREP